MMKITGLSHLFKWENLHNWWLTKYFFAPLCVYICVCKPLYKNSTSVSHVHVKWRLWYQCLSAMQTLNKQLLNDQISCSAEKSDAKELFSN